MARSFAALKTQPRWKPQQELPLSDWLTAIRRLPQVYGSTTGARYRLAYETGDGLDYPFLVEALGRFPLGLAERVVAMYRQVHTAHGRSSANDALLRLCLAAAPTTLSLTASDDELVAKARATADHVRRFVTSTIVPGALEYLKEAIRRLGIPIEPLLKRHAYDQLVARARDDLWWRRLIRVTLGRAFEAGAVMLGFVHRRAERYVSKRTLARRQEQLTRCSRVLGSYVAENESGEEYLLSTLAGKSVSNPAVRRAEWMARCYGFEQCAKAQGHVGLFLTITVPSRMHARLSASGEANPSYDGTTPDVANRHLTKLWAATRAALHRRSIRPYGMRIAEPHHDGTPHWHILLFVPPAQAGALIGLCQHYALSVDGAEPGARENRFKCEHINPAKGSATGYIAKYVSKNLDGYGIGSGENDAAGDSVRRVDAWRAVWGIRQFQQIGGPPVSVWRELRRLDPTQHSELLVQACEAAGNGNWRAFVDLMGGSQAMRKDRPIQRATAWSDRPNRYGEPTGTTLVGLRVGKLVVPTRIHAWRVRRASAEDISKLSPTPSQEPAKSPAFDRGEAGCGTRSGRAPPGGSPAEVARQHHSQRGPASNAGDSSSPWSSVNNCTVGVRPDGGCATTSPQAEGGESPSARQRRDTDP